MPTSKEMKPLTNFGKVFWNNQFKTTIPPLEKSHVESLQGKAAIITGANSGLGFEAAGQLLTLGLSRLVIAVRSQQRGDTAAQQLRQANTAAKIDVMLLDMESYDSIRAFVRQCDRELPRIDFAILNAGISPLSFRRNEMTGHESTVQVNHLSTGLLTILLLPVLMRKADHGEAARITIINSLTAHLCKFPNKSANPLLPSFDGTEELPWDPRERYGVSKLLSQLFLVRLSEQVDSAKITLNMVDPGLTKGTNLARDTSGALRLAATAFVNICGRPVKQGAATYAYALLSHQRESHGCFIMNNKIAPLAGIFYTAEGAEVSDRIWNETLSELDFAKARDILAALPR